jgi:hypothetical protein
MIKHVGKYQGKRIILLFREVPGDEHMCLVSFPDNLPTLYHDSIMKILESPAGQEAKSFSDVLHRNILPDGKNALEALHVNGFIKKVQTNQVLITPNSKSSIKLDELNAILNDIENGNKAEEKLKQANTKLDEVINTKPKKSNSRDLGDPIVAQEHTVLSDHDLAVDRLRQAESMRSQASKLLQEAQNLEAEAKSLDPTLNATPAKKKTTKVKKD